MSEIWSVYMVRCKNNSLYTGMAKDVQKRFEEHCAQGIKTAKYLRGKTPLELVYQEEIGSRSDALKIEHLIKKLSRAQKNELVKLGQYKGIVQLG